MEPSSTSLLGVQLAFSRNWVRHRVVTVRVTGRSVTRLLRDRAGTCHLRWDGCRVVREASDSEHGENREGLVAGDTGVVFQSITQEWCALPDAELQCPTRCQLM